MKSAMTHGTPTATLHAAGLVAAMLLPGPAAAHLVDTGLGPVYDGISHVLLSADDLLPVLGLALLAGLNGQLTGRRALFAIALAWLCGGLLGYLSGPAAVPGLATTFSLLIIGTLVALDRRLTPMTVVALAAALGLVHGWFNGAGIAAAERSVLALAGITGTIFVLVALLAAFVVQLKAPWTRIAVRAGGSWIAAVGVLMLGWGLRPA
ncbi:MAG: HupE/UreJ family protein [Burkholderiaceae bacterium]|nr:HupE/UreJ family protein [Burkholderiaceae bacterium]